MQRRQIGSSSSSTRSDAPIAVDQSTGGERIDLDAVQRRLQREIDELLLALGSAEITGRVLVPFAVFAELLVVAAAGIGKGLFAERERGTRAAVMSRPVLTSRVA